MTKPVGLSERWIEAALDHLVGGVWGYAEEVRPRVKEQYRALVMDVLEGAGVGALAAAIRQHREDIEGAGSVHVAPGWEAVAEEKHEADRKLWSVLDVDAGRFGRVDLMGLSVDRSERFLSRLREIARDCGYALAVHGSRVRDLDLIAVPWTPEAVSALSLVDALCEQMPLHPREINFYGDEHPWRMEPNPEIKPWGRLAWALDGVPGGTGWKYIDLSVAPRAGEPVPGQIAQGYRIAEAAHLARLDREAAA